MEKELPKLSVPARTSVPNAGALLAKKLRFSHFHVTLPNDPILADKGCSVFLGQTVLQGVLVMAVYSAKGLSPDLFFPGNPSATSLLRNQGLKVYGGAILARLADGIDQGQYLPVRAADFRAAAAAKSLYTAPEDDGAPVKPFNPRRREPDESRRPHQAPVRTPVHSDLDWRGLRGGLSARPAERSASKEQSPMGSTAGDSPHQLADARDCGATATTAVTDVGSALGDEPDRAKFAHHDSDATPTPSERGAGEEGLSVTALWDFTAATGTEISVAAGEDLLVLGRRIDERGEWSYGRLVTGPSAGSVGYFPDQILTTFPQAWRAVTGAAYSNARGGYLQLAAGAEVEVHYSDPSTQEYFGTDPRTKASGWFPRSCIA